MKKTVPCKRCNGKGWRDKETYWFNREGKLVIASHLGPCEDCHCTGTVEVEVRR